MVVIRLSRAGAKKRPFYHIVVTDSRRRRDSNYIESIGYFNPVARGQEVRLHLKTDRLAHWQSVGAQLSDRVKFLAKNYEAPAAKQDSKKEDKAA
ncbi:MAG: 30S ribosomal protein S16 [Legionellaceae bacterium]|nr:30S ribosomal protein S16 [Legionellaceae bacterium]